jgi:hypothetical protein
LLFLLPKPSVEAEQRQQVDPRAPFPAAPRSKPLVRSGWRGVLRGEHCRRAVPSDCACALAKKRTPLAAGCRGRVGKPEKQAGGKLIRQPQFGD